MPMKPSYFPPSSKRGEYDNITQRKPPPALRARVSSSIDSPCGSPPISRSTRSRSWGSIRDNHPSRRHSASDLPQNAKPRRLAYSRRPCASPVQIITGAWSASTSKRRSVSRRARSLWFSRFTLMRVSIIAAACLASASSNRNWFSVNDRGWRSITQRVPNA